MNDSTSETTQLEVLSQGGTSNLANEKALKTLTHVAYGLMTWGVLGMFDLSVPMIFSFGTICLPFILGGIIATSKLKLASSFWFANHYLWLVRTFWFSLLLQLITYSYENNGLVISTAILGAFWSLYRVIRGWLLLTELKTIPNYGKKP